MERGSVSFVEQTLWLWLIGAELLSLLVKVGSGPLAIFPFCIARLRLSTVSFLRATVRARVASMTMPWHACPIQFNGANLFKPSSPWNSSGSTHEPDLHLPVQIAIPWPVSAFNNANRHDASTLCPHFGRGLVWFLSPSENYFWSNEKELRNRRMRGQTQL